MIRTVGWCKAEERSRPLPVIWVVVMLPLLCLPFPSPRSRWTTAKRFHEQLLLLAESEDNISFLRRLELQIEEGMEQEVSLA